MLYGTFLMKWMLLSGLLLVLVGCTTHHKIMVGDAPVVIHHTKGHGKTFIHVHQNEKTALKAAQLVLRNEGGSLITLSHAGGRNIVFHLNQKRYEFDPNRIYTDAGIKKTLSEFSTYTPEAHNEVKKLAHKVKDLLPQGKVIAVHNNASYSLKDYLPGHDLAHDAQALYRNPKHYFRNFYLVTQKHDYLRLKLEGFNGVLQKPAATDDGSLSIFLANREYINVEAGYDQLSEQMNMLHHA